jgi:hypothetical protein
VDLYDDSDNWADDDAKWTNDAKSDHNWPNDDVPDDIDFRDKGRETAQISDFPYVHTI